MPPRLAIRPSLLGPARCGSKLQLCLGTRSPANRTLASSTNENRNTTKNTADSANPESGPLQLPPESPHYINVPTPRQPGIVRTPFQHGHMPVPRNVFTHRKPAKPKDGSAPLKKYEAATWTEAALPLSKAEEHGEPPENEHEAWRRRMTDIRRKSLETGLSDMWQRQETIKHRKAARATNVRNRHQNAAMSVWEEPDDVLTRTSMRESTIKNTAVIRDPLRHERQAEMAVRTAAIAQIKREGRRDALMELYQAAGKFIVNERELERKVEEMFRPDFFKEEGYRYGTVNAENIWEVQGKPPTMQDMMNSITRTETKLYDSRRTEVDRTTKRQKLVAEELTGGKMPM